MPTNSFRTLSPKKILRLSSFNRKNIIITVTISIKFGAFNYNINEIQIIENNTYIGWILSINLLQYRKTSQ